MGTRTSQATAGWLSASASWKRRAADTGIVRSHGRAAGRHAENAEQSAEPGHDRTRGRRQTRRHAMTASTTFSMRSAEPGCGVRSSSVPSCARPSPGAENDPGPREPWGTTPVPLPPCDACCRCVQPVEAPTALYPPTPAALRTLFWTPWMLRWSNGRSHHRHNSQQLRQMTRDVPALQRGTPTCSLASSQPRSRSSPSRPSVPPGVGQLAEPLRQEGAPIRIAALPVANPGTDPSQPRATFPDRHTWPHGAPIAPTMGAPLRPV
jgi:hypothetical protein